MMKINKQIDMSLVFKTIKGGKFVKGFLRWELERGSVIGQQQKEEGKTEILTKHLPFFGVIVFFCMDMEG